ncbi:dTDP-glucose 4,6-dehydratase [Lentilactobacillus sp. G22-6]|uniref:dTDP-glucose 4,6-dehydratase n=1 Tax=Lentilactobacillus dabitei TaxID=2831523 RepID=UPI001C26877E|nr:dTDP-glucose 4,6-dehydratase [Lentilactobacillus dabitei]MBU9789792.1 dTDP-glucose 4,6-dehydratase [Lentilactobacillus dabitei]
MNILVTGGAGFIGSNFIRYVLKTDSRDCVINLDALTYAGNLTNLSSVQNNSRYLFIHGNIADETLISKLLADYHIGAVVNFAAESHVDRSILNPRQFVESNYGGVSILLNCLKKFPGTRFIQVSTDEVYGSALSGQTFSETDSLNPSSPYAATKAGADLLALSYYKTFGMAVCITRSANNYGPYQFPEKLVPLMISHAVMGERLPVYGDGQNVRDWLNVLDNCRGIDAVLHRGKPGGVYNIAGHNYHSNLDVVKLILARLGLSTSAIQYVADRPANDELYAIDDSKIRTQLGWTPQVNFDVGMAQTIDWYKNNRDWWQPLLAKVKNR